VSAETFELLQECDRWSRRTGGVFCPLAGGAVQAWGYEASIRERAPGTAVSPQAQRQPSEPLVVDERERTARVPAGARLDLGGIAKMWSATRAGALLRRRSADPFLLVDAGGDMVAARGEHVVIVEDPADPGGAPLTYVRVAEGSGVATSGWTRRHWRNGDGREAHHIIDPELGEPAPRAQATVVADEPVAAEVLAKVVVLRPDALTQIDAAALRVNGSGAVPNERWKVLAP
jgi:thiamine biosynthesis lipoprotein